MLPFSFLFASLKSFVAGLYRFISAPADDKRRMGASGIWAL